MANILEFGPLTASPKATQIVASDTSGAVQLVQVSVQVVQAEMTEMTKLTRHLAPPN